MKSGKITVLMVVMALVAALFTGIAGAAGISIGQGTTPNQSPAAAKGNLKSAVQQISLIAANGVNNIDFNYSNVYHTAGQSFGGLTTRKGTASYRNYCELSMKIDNKAGQSETLAQQFRSEVHNVCENSPKYLTFYVKGELIIDGNSYNIVIGQDMDCGESWAIGGTATGWTDQGHYISTPDGKYVIVKVYNDYEVWKNPTKL